MAGTISPVVYRNSGRNSWLVAATIYTLSSVVGGSFVGALLGSLGTFLFPLSLYRNNFPLLIGLSTIAYSLHELHFVSLPHPQRQRQVTSHWRNVFHPYITAGLFGLLLGAGFVTFIPTATYYVLGLTVILYGSPTLGTLIFAIYGAARASLLWLLSLRAVTVATVEQRAHYMMMTKPIMRQVNGFALAMSGAYLISTYLWPR